MFPGDRARSHELIDNRQGDFRIRQNHEQIAGAGAVEGDADCLPVVEHRADPLGGDAVLNQGTVFSGQRRCRRILTAVSGVSPDPVWVASQDEIVERWGERGTDLGHVMRMAVANTDGTQHSPPGDR